jgi:uncharacterized protein YbbC (DUF1343 family)
MLLLVRLVVAGCLLAAVSVCAEVQLGSEVLGANGFTELQGKRVGLITNPSGVNRHGESTIELLRNAPGVKLVALFGPEHGVNGNVKAGESIAEKSDKRTRLPIHSLYGATRKPTTEMLRGLDALVYDLQDTGVRSYTFISTMGLAMEACAEAGIEFVVLDRPNPLGGVRVEGSMVEERFRSFVGRWDVPYVYGLTCGELARMINSEGWIKRPCRLTVVPMTGWRRSMVWRDTGLPWVPPSPNIPLRESPLYYASTGLFGEIAGGSGVSIGTRFQRPFEIVAAPWLDGAKLSRQMNSYGFTGVSFPKFGATYEDKPYQGVELRFSDPVRAPLVVINLCFLEAIRAVAGRDLFGEALKGGKDLQMFDKVNGTDATRSALRAGRLAMDIANSWKPGEETFRQRRRKYLLYPETVPTPSAQVSPAKPATTRRISETATKQPGFVVITVSKGDTINKIAKDFGVTLNAIADANPGTNVLKIKVGQKLRIPRP